jgi:hypothetical protein
MKAKLIGALVALGLWMQPAQASTFQLPKNGDVLITGFQSQSVRATVYVNINWNLPPNTPENPNEVAERFSATIYAESLNSVPPPDTYHLVDWISLLDFATNQVGAGSSCRYAPCATSGSLTLFGGIGDYRLSIGAGIEVLGAGLPGYLPSYELFITLPDGLSVVTPLPAALPLFATGLGMMGLFAWRRKRKGAAAIAA